MSYNPINWQNEKIGGTKVNATNLNIMDKGIADAHDILADHDNKINDFANQQIPEEYVKESVDNYISENQAGIASKEEVLAVAENVNQLSSEIVEIRDAFSSSDIIAYDSFNKENVSVSLQDNVYTVDIENVTLFNSSDAKHPIMLKENAYYYEGFKIVDVVNSAWNKNLGFVFAKNDESYYFVTMQSNVLGSVYSVNYSTGAYTQIGEKLWNGSEADIFEILSADLNAITFKITSYNGTDKGSYTVDLSNMGINELCIGFMPYGSPISIKFNQNRYMYEEYATIKDIEKYNPKISLITNALSGNNMTIKLLGDSITAGLGGSDYDVSESSGGNLLFWDRYQNINGYCWANLLKSYAEAKFPNVTVKNYGVSGANSYNLVQYFTSNNLVDNEDDIVIVMIGTNDRSTADAKTYLYNNLVSLYEKITDMGKNMIVMSNIPASVSNEETHANMHMEDVDMVVNAFSIDYKIPHISVYKLFIEYCQTRNIEIDSLLSDGLHPNDGGYDVMFYLISNELGFTTKRDGATW